MMEYLHADLNQRNIDTQTFKFIWHIFVLLVEPKQILQFACVVSALRKEHYRVRD